MELLSNIEIIIYSNNRRGKPFFKSLHGLSYNLAGKDYPHIHNSPPKFHPVIKKWNTNKEGTNATLSLKTVDEDLLNNIVNSLKENDNIHIGKNEFKVKEYKIIKQEHIDFNGEIPSLPNYFKIDFKTPTTFRTKNNGEPMTDYQTIAFPDIHFMIRSMARNAHKLFGFECTLEEQRNIADKIIIFNSVILPQQVRLAVNMPIIDTFMGYIHLDISELNYNQKQTLGKLLKVSTYTGVGFKKGFGLGDIQITRPIKGEINK